MKSLSPLTISENENVLTFFILKYPCLIFSSPLLMGLCNYEEIWVNRGGRRRIQYEPRNNKTYVLWSCSKTVFLKKFDAREAK